MNFCYKHNTNPKLYAVSKVFEKKIEKFSPQQKKKQEKRVI